MSGTDWLAAALLLPAAVACLFVDIAVVPLLLVYDIIVGGLLSIVSERQEIARLDSPDQGHA